LRREFAPLNGLVHTPVGAEKCDTSENERVGDIEIEAVAQNGRHVQQLPDQKDRYISGGDTIPIDRIFRHGSSFLRHDENTDR
jgi:hypothetical protein